MMTYEKDMKNRIFFTMYCQYLKKSDIDKIMQVICKRTNLNLADTNSTIRHFSYVLNADEIADCNVKIEKNTANFRGKCLAKIQEYAIHYSDRKCQKPRINSIINAMNKLSDASSGLYFT